MLEVVWSFHSILEMVGFLLCCSDNYSEGNLIIAEPVIRF